VEEERKNGVEWKDVTNTVRRKLKVLYENDMGKRYPLDPNDGQGEDEEEDRYSEWEYWS